MTNLDYLYNPDAAKEHFSKNYFSDKKLGFRTIEQGTILPQKSERINGKRLHVCGGVYDKNGEFVKGTFIDERTVPTKIYYPPPRINSIQF